MGGASTHQTHTRLHMSNMSTSHPRHTSVPPCTHQHYKCAVTMPCTRAPKTSYRMFPTTTRPWYIKPCAYPLQPYFSMLSHTCTHIYRHPRIRTGMCILLLERQEEGKGLPLPQFPEYHQQCEQTLPLPPGRARSYCISHL